MKKPRQLHELYSLLLNSRKYPLTDGICVAMNRMRKAEYISSEEYVNIFGDLETHKQEAIDLFQANQYTLWWWRGCPAGLKQRKFFLKYLIELHSPKK